MITLEEKLIVLGENWDSIKKRVVIPLWNGRFKSMYESIKLDYDDFESLAGIELSKAIKTFDPESQRAIENISSITIYPASEYVMTKDMVDSL